MFLLMSQFASKAGLSRALFEAANTYLGHRKGGVAMAAVGGCAGFGAICGSSLATAATIVSIGPETSKSIRAHGLTVGLESRRRTTQSVVDELVAHYPATPTTTS